MKWISKHKKILITPIIALIVSIIGLQQVDAGSVQAGWYLLIDEQTNTLIGMVVDDKIGGGAKPEETYTTDIETDCSQLNVNGSGITSSNIEVPKKIEGASCTLNSQNILSREKLAWTWPVINGHDANGKDFAMAEWVNNTLLDGFNMAIQKVINENNLDFAYRSGFPKLLNNLANDAYAATHGSPGTFTHTVSVRKKGGGIVKQNYKYTMSPVTKDELENKNIILTEPDWGPKSFVKIKVHNTSSEIIVPYRVPKGYYSNQRLYGTIEQGKSYGPRYVSWSHVAYSASYNLLNKGVDANNTDDLFDPSGFEKMIYGLLENLVRSVTGFIGLEPIENLTLNRGVLSVTNYKGLMPRSWFSGASLIYWVFQIIAIFVIGISIAKLLVEKNLSVVNPGKRVEVMDRITKVIIASFMLVLFIPSFTIIATLNELFVSTLSAVVPSDATLSMTMTTGVLSAIIVQFFFLFILIKINITYIVRSITILILYSTAPWFISNYPLGEGGKIRFQTWLKELLVNIFMQTFHAIMTVIFLTTLRYTELKIIQKIVMLTTYVSLSDYFKNQLMGASSGADSVSDNTSSSLVGLGGTVLAGMIGGHIFRKNNTTSKKASTGSYASGNEYSNNPINIDNITNDQKKSFTKDNTPHRGYIGEKTQGIKNTFNEHLGSKNSYITKKANNESMNNFEKAKGIAIDTGRAVKHLNSGTQFTKRLKNIGRTTSLAGISMGMEAVGASSGVVKHRLAEASADIGSDLWTLANGELINSSIQEYYDFTDGDTSVREMNLSGKGLNDQYGISGAFITSNDKDKFDADIMNFNGEMTENSVFDDDENYMAMYFNQDSDVYENLNNANTRQSALIGLQEMCANDMKYGASGKGEVLVDNGYIVGMKKSIGKNTSIRGYHNGNNKILTKQQKDYIKENSRKGWKTQNPESINMFIKNGGAMDANAYTKSAIERRKK